MASDEDYTRTELIGCDTCDFSEPADETVCIPHVECPDCEDGRLERQYEFEGVDGPICSCGRAPVAEDMMLGIDCTKCLAEDFCPLP